MIRFEVDSIEEAADAAEVFYRMTSKEQEAIRSTWPPASHFNRKVFSPPHQLKASERTRRGDVIFTWVPHDAGSTTAQRWQIIRSEHELSEIGYELWQLIPSPKGFPPPPRLDPDGNWVESDYRSGLPVIVSDRMIEAWLKCEINQDSLSILKRLLGCMQSDYSIPYIAPRGPLVKAFTEKLWLSHPKNFISTFDRLCPLLKLDEDIWKIGRDEPFWLCEILDNMARILVDALPPHASSKTQKDVQRVHRDLNNWNLQLEMLRGQAEARREAANLPVEQILMMWWDARDELAENRRGMGRYRINNRIGYGKGLLNCLIERADELNPLGPGLDPEMVEFVHKLKAQHAERALNSEKVNRRGYGPRLAKEFKARFLEFAEKYPGKDTDEIVELFRKSLFDNDESYPKRATIRKWYTSND